MELSEGEKIIQEAIRRKKEDEKRERKCNQELKKWDVRSSIKLQGSNEPSQLIFFTTEDPKNEDNDY